MRESDLGRSLHNVKAFAKGRAFAERKPTMRVAPSSRGHALDDHFRPGRAVGAWGEDLEQVFDVAVTQSDATPRTGPADAAGIVRAVDPEPLSQLESVLAQRIVRVVLVDH